jgi:hypothetical protein
MTDPLATIERLRQQAEQRYVDACWEKYRMAMEQAGVDFAAYEAAMRGAIAEHFRREVDRLVHGDPDAQRPVGIMGESPIQTHMNRDAEEGE